MKLAELSRKGVLPVLVRLAASDPTPLSAKQFVQATGMEAGAAIRLRGDLESYGVLTVAVVRPRGSVKEYEITLTPLGRRLAEAAVRMEEVVAQARKERVRRAARED